MSPGKWGWVGVVAAIVAADGYALARKRVTMSDEFYDHAGWGLFLLAGTAAHLVAHKRLRVYPQGGYPA